MKERKFSAKREEILSLLQSTESHPGAVWVYGQLKPRIPDLSLATVYRNINIFCEEKKARSLGVIRGEERFDGNSTPHPHFICTRCGVIQDIPLNKSGSFPEEQCITKETFFIDHRKTMFFGLCRDCTKNHHGGGNPGAA